MSLLSANQIIPTFRQGTTALLMSLPTISLSRGVELYIVIPHYIPLLSRIVAPSPPTEVPPLSVNCFQYFGHQEDQNGKETESRREAKSQEWRETHRNRCS